MVIYFTGVVLAMLSLMFLSIYETLKNNKTKPPLDLLDVIFLSLFSWLVIVLFIMVWIVTEILEKQNDECSEAQRNN